MSELYTYKAYKFIADGFSKCKFYINHGVLFKFNVTLAEYLHSSILTGKPYTVELQWLEHLWDHEN